MSRRVIVAAFLLDHWREVPSSGGESAFFSASTVGTTVAWYDFLLYSVVTGGRPACPRRPVVEDNRNGSRITRTESQARSGSKEGVVRYVLIAGLVLVVIGFVVAYLFK
jgi:hypothetical protein